MQALAQSHCVVFAMMMAKLQFLKRRGSGGSKAHVSLNKGECVRKVPCPRMNKNPEKFASPFSVRHSRSNAAVPNVECQGER